VVSYHIVTLLYDVTTQKTATWIFIAVKTSSLSM